MTSCHAGLGGLDYFMGIPSFNILIVLEIWLVVTLY